MMFGRGETWKIEFPSAALIIAHESPFCKCCHQRLPLAALEPTFMYSMGENCGYDPVYPEDVLQRWNDTSISCYVDEVWQVAHGQYLHFRKEIAELILFAFGHQVREHLEYDALTLAKDWLKLAESSSVLTGWSRDKERCLRFTETRLVYAKWVLKAVKTRLREMKREGKIPTSACVR